MKKTLFTAAAAALLLSACASTTPASPVLTRSDATHETTGVGSTKQKAQEAAIAAAKKQCGLRSPVVITDKHTYNGILDERTGRVLEQGVSIATGIFGITTPNLSRNDDYEYYLKFKCQ